MFSEDIVAARNQEMGQHFACGFCVLTGLLEGVDPFLIEILAKSRDLPNLIPREEV